MDKIKEFRTSIERLSKVWQSKIDFDEEELVAEDLVWFTKIFDKFFEGKNLIEFVNRAGRYEEIKIAEIDFSKYLIEDDSKIDSSLDIKKPNRLQYYNQLNEYNSKNFSEYNIIDIYFRTYKKLYYSALGRELQRTKSIVLSQLISTVYKVCLFEKEGFNSKALLSDFFYTILKGLFTRNELVKRSPDEDFISTALFKSVFLVYYSPLFNYNKVPILKQYLIDIWIHLNRLPEEVYIEEFSKSLTGMTLSITNHRNSYYYEILRHLKSQDYKEVVTKLNTIKLKSRMILSIGDLKSFEKLLNTNKNTKLPEYLDERLYDNFLDHERNRAIELYKFSEIQSLVLEYLGVVYSYREKEYLFNCIEKLRNGIKFSNHLQLLPSSIEDIIKWMKYYSEISFRILGGFYILSPNVFIKRIFIFLFKSFTFEKDLLIGTFESLGIDKNPAELTLLKNVAEELKCIDNELLNSDEINQFNNFIIKLINLIQFKIDESEKTIPLSSSIFEGFVNSIGHRYKEKSLFYFLSNNLPSSNRKGSIDFKFNTQVTASDLLLRKYLFSDWPIATHGLSDSIGNYLIEKEILQFEANLFNELPTLQNKELDRKSFFILLKKQNKESIFLFRNSFSNFWVQDLNINNSVLTYEKLNHSIFDYKTYDGNPEIIIIPKSGLFINYVFDLSLKEHKPFENIFYWKFFDFGAVNSEKMKSIQNKMGHPNHPNISLDQLKRYFRISIIVKSKILVKQRLDINRFRLDPYSI